MRRRTDGGRLQKFREEENEMGRMIEEEIEIETAMVEVNGESIEERLQYSRSNNISWIRRTGEVEGRRS